MKLLCLPALVLDVLRTVVRLPSLCPGICSGSVVFELLHKSEDVDRYQMTPHQPPLP